MNIEKFTIAEKNITLYTIKADLPLVVLNNFSDDGREIYQLCVDEGEQFNMVCVSGLNWNRDMTPWCPKIDNENSKLLSNEMGGADEYLQILRTQILSEAYKKIGQRPKKVSIVGYSLGGLFALYSMYRCDEFSSASSVSGSMWFPNFKEFVFDNDFYGSPEKIYISLGDKEEKTRNPLMRAVRENTEEIVENIKSKNINVQWELNEGNHFKDAVKRTARAISRLVT